MTRSPYSIDRDWQVFHFIMKKRLVFSFLEYFIFEWQNLIADVKSFSKHCNKVIFYYVLFELQGLKITVPPVLHYVRCNQWLKPLECCSELCPG